MKKEKQFEIIFNPLEVSFSEHQKRMDEVSEILYELFCQHQLKQSVQKNLDSNNLSKEGLS